MRLQSVIDAFFIGSVLAAIFVSGALLNNLGLGYSGIEGEGLKIHPYTVLIVASCSCLFFSLKFKRGHIWFFDWSYIYLFIFSLVLFFRYGFSGLGYILDTFWAAFIVVALVRSISESVLAFCRTTIIVFFIGECLFSVFEVLTQTNYIPIDIWYGSYFRSTALHGHPLNNALIVSSVGAVLIVSSALKHSIGFYFLGLSALAAFGARGAFAVYLLMGAVYYIWLFRRNVLAVLASVILAAMALPLLFWALYSFGVGERLVAQAYWDNSAYVRFDLYEIFDHLTPVEFIWGVDPRAQAGLLEYVGIGVIENFWVYFLISYGLVLGGGLILAVVLIMKSIYQASIFRARAFFCIALFLVVASTNNSLATKTPALFLFFISCMLFLGYRRNEAA